MGGIDVRSWPKADELDGTLVRQLLTQSGLGDRCSLKPFLPSILSVMIFATRLRDQRHELRSIGIRQPH